MKNIKLFSLLATIVTIVAVIFSLTNFYSIKKVIPISSSKPPVQYDSLAIILQNMKEHSTQSRTDTISNKEYNFQLSELQQQLASFKEATNDHVVLASDKGFTTQTFWIKVIFSGIFCIAALFVILSKKYDDETKKWAFSVLTLIAGVWIGTIS